jgi:hypothetical protein
MSDPKGKLIDSMAKLAQELGIGDGTKETILVIGIHMFISEADKALEKGDNAETLKNIINALKGIATYIAKDNDARKGN